MPNDLWSGYLNDNPEAAYFSYGNQWKTPNMRRFFQNQFSNIQQQYMGRLGQLVQGGGAPNLEFTDFLKQFNWGQDYQQQQPQQDTGRFNPWTRWVLP